MQFKHNKGREVSFDGAFIAKNSAEGQYVMEAINGVPAVAGGTLVISIMHAKLLHDKDAIGKMDPYVVIDHNGAIQKTNVHDNGGVDPVWTSQNFEYKVDNMEDEIKFTLMDDETFKDDQIGVVAGLKMKDLCASNGFIDIKGFNVVHKGKTEGQLFIKTKYMPVLPEGEIDES